MEFTIWEKVNCLAIMGAVTGPAARIRKAYKLMELFEIDDEEKKRIGMTHSPDGGIMWMDNTGVYEIEIKDRELVSFFKSEVANWQHWMAREYQQMTALFEKLEIPLE